MSDQSNGTVGQGYSISVNRSEFIISHHPIVNSIIVGQRSLEPQATGINFELESQSGIMDYLNINHFLVDKKMILKEFDKYDLYADIYGRVDNTDGRYTTDGGVLTPTSMRTYFDGQQPFIARTSRPSRPSIPSRKVTSKLPTKKIMKSTKGGY